MQKRETKIFIYFYMPNGEKSAKNDDRTKIMWFHVYHIETHYCSLLSHWNVWRVHIIFKQFWNTFNRSNNKKKYNIITHIKKQCENPQHNIVGEKEGKKKAKRNEKKEEVTAAFEIRILGTHTRTLPVSI